MSKFNETVKTYLDECKKTLKINVDEDLLVKVAKGLGPAIYNADACKISGSDKKELATVKNNFLIKKLGMKNSPKLDIVIDEVMEQMGRSNRNKYRAIAYYLLVKKLGKEAIYNN